MRELRGVSRGRPLTPEESQRYQAIRQQIEQEKPEIERRLQTETPGPGSWEDVKELRHVVQALRELRERRGLSREQAAEQAALKPQQIADLEEDRSINPQVSVLSRYAMALGYHLVLAVTAAPAKTSVISDSVMTTAAPTV